MRDSVTDWFDRCTVQNPSWDSTALVEAKRGRTVSVVIPALNEESTVGGVVAAAMSWTGSGQSLVDDVLVVDSGSVDGTRDAARAAGARVLSREEALPGVPVRPGKGEVLWRSLAATDGDIVVFLDSDLLDVRPEYVSSLVGPLLLETGATMVKGFYRRPLRIGEEESESGGGRVTELLARPLITALRPALAGVVQPLGGEYAATRDLLESLSFAGGYGVEIGLLLDVESSCGLDALFQVNLGVRKHRNRTLPELGVMSRQILVAVLERCGVPDSTDPLVQFVPVTSQWLPIDRPVLLEGRPPMREYLAVPGRATRVRQRLD